jgi:hypothetical protein
MAAGSGTELSKAAGMAAGSATELTEAAGKTETELLNAIVKKNKTMFH